MPAYKYPTPVHSNAFLRGRAEGGGISKSWIDAQRLNLEESGGSLSPAWVLLAQVGVVPGLPESALAVKG